MLHCVSPAVSPDAQLIGAVQLEISSPDRMHDRSAQVKYTFLDRASTCTGDDRRAPIEGIDHFRPLRHYAEETCAASRPLPQGRDGIAATVCGEDVLDRNGIVMQRAHSRTRASIWACTHRLDRRL